MVRLSWKLCFVIPDFLSRNSLSGYLYLYTDITYALKYPHFGLSTKINSDLETNSLLRFEFTNYIVVIFLVFCVSLFHDAAQYPMLYHLLRRFFKSRTKHYCYFFLLCEDPSDIHFNSLFFVFFYFYVIFLKLVINIQLK